MKKEIILTLALSVFAVACGEDNENETEKLIGVQEGAEYEIKRGSDSELTKLKFQNGQLIHTEIRYEKPYSDREVSRKVTAYDLLLGSEVNTEIDGSERVLALDLSLVSMSLVYLTPERTEWANSRIRCGSSNWVRGEALDLLEHIKTIAYRPLVELGTSFDSDDGDINPHRSQARLRNSDVDAVERKYEKLKEDLFYKVNDEFTEEELDRQLADQKRDELKMMYNLYHCPAYDQRGRLEDFDEDALNGYASRLEYGTSTHSILKFVNNPEGEDYLYVGVGAFEFRPFDSYYDGSTAEARHLDLYDTRPFVRINEPVSE